MRLSVDYCSTGVEEATVRGARVEGMKNQAVNTPRNDELSIRFDMIIDPTPWKDAMIRETRGVGIQSSGSRDDLAYFATLEPYQMDGTTTVAVSYRMPNYDQVRFQAIDKNGRRLEPEPGGSAGTGGHTFAQYRLKGVTPDDIKSWVLQGRRYKLETVEFRHVSLVAGRRTLVEAVKSH
jgi:hypothetical protein